MVKKTLPLITILFLTLFSVRYLFLPGFPPTHDGEYHIIRFYEFYKTLQSGVIYPRWAMDLNFGYGLPLFNYVYPLPNYFSAILHLFGASFIDSFKISMIIASIMGGIFFYLWMKEFVDEKYALVASIVYIFSPYRFLDIIIRGSVGEVWALSFLPAFLWSITIYTKYNVRTYLALSVIFLSLTVFSHNILGMMFFGFSLLYTAFLRYLEKKEIIFLLIKLSLLTVGITCIFWLPALWEKRYVVGLEVFNPENNFPEIYQLLIPSWGSGFSSGDLNNQMSFQIGVVNLIMIFLSIILLVKGNKNKRMILFFQLMFLLTFFMMTVYSLVLWQKVPLVKYFQFPWRLLSLIILLSSFLSGFVLQYLKRDIFIVLTIVLCIILTYSYAKPAYMHQRTDSYYTSRSNFIDGTNSPGNVFNIANFNPPKTRSKEFFQNSTSIKRFTEIESFPQSKIYEVTSSDKTLFVANTAYFPGWTVFVNGNRQKILVTKQGLISFNLDKGRSYVKLVFQNTVIRSISSIISVISILICIAILMNYKYAKRSL